MRITNHLITCPPRVVAGTHHVCRTGSVDCSIRPTVYSRSRIPISPSQILPSRISLQPSRMTPRDRSYYYQARPADSAEPHFALGGYFFPFISTLGSQVHHSSCEMLSRTLGMCAPQPYQVALSTEGSCQHGGLRKCFVSGISVQPSRATRREGIYVLQVLQFTFIHILAKGEGAAGFVMRDLER